MQSIRSDRAQAAWNPGARALSAAIRSLQGASGFRFQAAVVPARAGIPRTGTAPVAAIAPGTLAAVMLAAVTLAGCAGGPETGRDDTAPDTAGACSDGGLLCGLASAAGFVVYGVDGLVALAFGDGDTDTGARPPAPGSVATVAGKAVIIPPRKPDRRWCPPLDRTVPLADCATAAGGPVMAAAGPPDRPAPAAGNLKLPPARATTLAFNRTISLRLAGRITGDADTEPPQRFAGTARFTMAGLLIRRGDGARAPLRLVINSVSGISTVTEAGLDTPHRFETRRSDAALYRVDLTVGPDGRLRQAGPPTGRVFGATGAVVWNGRDSIRDTVEAWIVPTRFLLAAPYRRTGLAPGRVLSPDLALYSPAAGLDRSGALDRSLAGLAPAIRGSRVERTFTDGGFRAIEAVATATVAQGPVQVGSEMREFIDRDSGERYRMVARTAIRRTDPAGDSPVLSIISETVTVTGTSG